MRLWLHNFFSKSAQFESTTSDEGRASAVEKQKCVSVKDFGGNP